ncbi:hypothetical protein [Flavobacterium hercynium]|uniref:Uncharacterized protein n=1 Tax=Flavobacterium hercynium TaxID=387094 RepID=A0A226HAF5_9FLAO|nr:hypothetical protein [Flavobacterium hercynium]OXA91267.1 hypothetical protein B0A66_11890 [Flavobacterium hercynium]SMP12573.1 hypothetical protein SAMN06265346_103256 [Flavobacterium hercynium]
MPNNTREDYKEAIRIKFEKERDKINSVYLNPPSQANLRDLCWKILKSNPSSDDLNTYSDFFNFQFDSNIENIDIVYTNKFKKVGRFLRRIIEPARFETVELAAILVNFELRPYEKFYYNRGNDEEQPDVIVDTFVTDDPEKDVVEENLETSSTERENEEEDENEEEGVESTIIEDTPVKISFSEQLKHIFTNNPTRRLKKTLLGVVVIFGLIASVIYFAFFKMHCMQWSEDHYEIVDCTPELGANGNLIIPLDERLLDFKKVTVCDTTSCFRPDGQAIVWYAKNKDKAEFFNSNGIGRHPETERALRPVTEYIKGKYKTPCESKHK